MGFAQPARPEVASSRLHLKSPSRLDFALDTFRPGVYRKNVVRECEIRVADVTLRAAVCPTCHTKCYPAELARRCFERHVALTTLENYVTCRNCHRPRLRAECEGSNAKICRDCREKRTGGVFIAGQGLKYSEYLSDRAYTWTK